VASAVARVGGILAPQILRGDAADGWVPGIILTGKEERGREGGREEEREMMEGLASYESLPLVGTWVHREDHTSIKASLDGSFSFPLIPPLHPSSPSFPCSIFFPKQSFLSLRAPPR